LRVSSRRVLVGGLLAACCLGLATLQVSARTPASNGGLAYAPAPESEEEGKKEGRELIYKIINVSILVGALAFLLRKPVADFFGQRSASIRTGLEEGRKALEASQAQLKAAEEKLKHLEEEIADFKASAAREMEAESQRLKVAAAEAAEKIIQSARAQTDVAVRAAKLELKMYTAQQAVNLAEEIIRQRLDDAGRKKLVGDFLADVEDRPTLNS
jgi:F-type H+-transporting ATPase subunit b